MTYAEIQILELQALDAEANLISAYQKLKESEIAVDQEYARLYLLGRSEPDKLGLSKPTEEGIKAAIICYPAYAKLLKDQAALKIEHLAAQLNADALRRRLTFERDFFLKNLNP